MFHSLSLYVSFSLPFLLHFTWFDFQSPPPLTILLRKLNYHDFSVVAVVSLRVQSSSLSLQIPNAKLTE
ncbi:hypothetical protein Lalb_Chr24g0401311 [Lupinus albus]|uniref:Uncharacterized protein n=1 Tax=Lupinus albus TaxID=3870 RepID=A0A6A4NID8_LUPAL|nr:hypothetical protein Lalb_Chr24g0401311 [Lupinus albus]